MNCSIAEVEPLFEGYDTPGVYCYNLQANKVVECMLHFTPQEVSQINTIQSFISPMLYTRWLPMIISCRC